MTENLVRRTSLNSRSPIKKVLCHCHMTVCKYLWPKEVGGWDEYTAKEGEQDVVERRPALVILKVRLSHRSTSLSRKFTKPHASKKA